MNISDDIAYSMSDIEDGIEKKVVNEKDINELLIQLNEFLFRVNLSQLIKNVTLWSYNENLSHLVNNNLYFKNYNVLPTKNENEKLVYYFIQKIKTQLINMCVKESASIFIENIEEVLVGNFSFDDYLKKPRNKFNILNILSEIKSFSKRRIYTHESVEKIELAGDKILRGLLNIYEPILGLSEENFNVLVDYKYGYINEIKDSFKIIKEHNLHYESRLFNTIPKNYVIRYQKALKYFKENINKNIGMNEQELELNLRCHILVDYISGMTDDFALERYNLLSGHAIK